MAALTPESLRNVKSALTTPTATGAKATTFEVAKGAAKGAATGGWVGAARGAAVSFARTSAGRRIIAVVGVLALVSVLMLPVGIIVGLTVVNSSAAYGDSFRAGQSATSAGNQPATVTEAMNTASRYGIQWEVALAVSTVQKNVDLQKLTEALQRNGARTIGVSGVYVSGKGLTAGTSTRETQMGASEKKQYLAALTEYGLTPAQADRAYSMALKWAFGQSDTCTATETANTAQPGVPGTSNTAQPGVAGTSNTAQSTIAEMTLSDGSKYTPSTVQAANAKVIITEASKIPGVTKDAVIVALMAALTESGLQNYANSTVPESLTYPHDAVGSDHDSVGFWQMRPGWGTVKNLRDPAYQVRAFFGGPSGPNKGTPRGLLDIPGWDTMPKGNAAQAVEVSAFPDRYAKNEPVATAVLQRFGTGVSYCNGGTGVAGIAGHPLGDASIPVVSRYGPRAPGPGSLFHEGIDFGAACATPIYAIADGTVTHSGPEGNWGNTVVIDHGNGLVTRSAHQPFGAVLAPLGTQVKKGDRIGMVGSSGISTGCHLHFETLVNGKYVDPAQVLKDMGVTLTFAAGS